MKHWTEIRPIQPVKYSTYEEELKSLGTTREGVERAVAEYDDLQVQAMMFDMDIDIETWSLVPKRKDETPQWLKNWKEKMSNADFDTHTDIDRE